MVTGTKEAPGRSQRPWNGSAGGGATPANKGGGQAAFRQGVAAPVAARREETPRGVAAGPAKAVEPVGNRPPMAMTPTEKLVQRIIGCAIEVHRHLGPGLPEAAYEAALCRELELGGLKYRSRLVFPALYKGEKVGEYRVALLVEDEVVVEARSVERVDPVHEALVLTLMKVAQKKAGLFLNFNSRLLKEGMRKFVF